MALNNGKPYNDGARSIAVRDVPESRTLTGGYSELDEQSTHQKLAGLNISDSLSIDDKTRLFTALTGRLDSHPNGFNLK